jgi:hypothetical protein
MTEETDLLAEPIRQRRLEVLIKSTWHVPEDWKIVDDQVQLPDGRIVNFWPEIELEDPVRGGSGEFKTVDWQEAELSIGIVFYGANSVSSAGPVE